MSSANCSAEAYRRSGSLRSAISTIVSRSPARIRLSRTGNVPRAAANSSGVDSVAVVGEGATDASGASAEGEGDAVAVVEADAASVGGTADWGRVGPPASLNGRRTTAVLGRSGTCSQMAWKISGVVRFLSRYGRR